MGGFLQAVLFGYGGLRLKTESLVFEKPTLIDKTSRLIFRHLNYLGTVFDYIVEAGSIRLSVTETGNMKLRLNATGMTSDFTTGTRNILSIFCDKTLSFIHHENIFLNRSILFSP